MTLVILAAGMGSRYGGLKQLDPMTEHKEVILDFSVFDAKRAGFDKVVFIIKKEMEQLFKETVGDRIAEQIKVEYAFQAADMLPQGYTVPPGREKPWGTGHALLCAEEAVGEENMMVINADDFYGEDTYRVIGNFLKETEKASRTFCMGGFVLKNTLTENGSVSRGICETDEKGYLTQITERTKILRNAEGQVGFEDEGKFCPTDENGYASMNCWGFTSAIFPLLKENFVKFLQRSDGDMMKKEFYLPACVDGAIQEGKCAVKVLPTKARWYGVTYAEDKPKVVASIKALVESGAYPDGLYGN